MIFWLFIFSRHETEDMRSMYFIEEPIVMYNPMCHAQITFRELNELYLSYLTPIVPKYYILKSG